MSRAPRVGGLAMLSLVAVLAAGRAQIVWAHPTATTTITITLDGDCTFEVTLTTDPNALVTKLEALGGGVMSGTLAPDARDARLAALASTLVEHLDIRFGGVRVDPRLVGISSASGQPSVIRLAGAIRPGAAYGTWSTSLVYGSYPVVIRRAGTETDSVQWLQGPQPSDPFPVTARPPTSRARIIGQDFRLGYTHILPNGFDHILFVLGLFLLTTRMRSVILQASAFTLAHSITLGLTLYGVVSAPASIVEPLIALSIVYVAFENIFTSDLRPWRVALVFAFGLLHGMGFAEALARLALPRSEYLTTLVTFNLGVEAGQLTIIALAALLVRACAVPAADYRRLIVRPASAAIALTGLVWVIQRVI
jgi:hypothetical protein